MIVVQPAKDGARGIDCITILDHASAARLVAAGYSFAVRYLGSLTIAERDAILGAGMALLAVGFSRRPGWAPSQALGAADGAAAVAHAKAAGLPPVCTLFCDLEGPSGTGADAAAYVNAWAEPVQAAGYVAGLYVGYEVKLTPSELYALKVTGYWASCSRPQDVAVRGYQMRQDPHANQIVAGVQVDVDVISTDGRGDTPMWVVQAA